MFRAYLWGIETYLQFPSFHLLPRLERTYEELKPSLATVAECIANRLERTYEELKRWDNKDLARIYQSLERTYEELKPEWDEEKGAYIAV